MRLTFRSRETAVEKELTDQFFVTLRSTLRQCEKTRKKDNFETVEKIETLLTAQSESWDNAYKIERLLISLYSETQVKIELNRRVLEAERNLFADEYDYYRKLTKSDRSDDENRAILNRLVNDLQWRYTIKQLKRQLAKTVRSKFSWSLVAASSLFLCVFFAPVFRSLLLKNPSQLNGHHFYLLVAFFAGLWGASFSLNTSLNERLSDSGLENHRLFNSGAYLFSRMIVGASASLILYFFLHSGLLAGTIFPDIISTPSMTDPYPLYNSTLYLLTIWSFIAGFSEKFIPNILAKTENKGLKST